MKKKKVKKHGRMNVTCSERNRLWAAFLKVGKEWESIKAKMRKVLKQGDTPSPDLARLEDIQIRIKTTHKLFGEHIAKHGCWQPKISMLKKARKKRKHSK